MSMFGKHHREETKRKISIAHKGRKRTLAHCKNISIANMGRIPWNKGIHQWKNKPHPRGMLGKKNHNIWNKGKHFTKKICKKISIGHKKLNLIREKCANWKGGKHIHKGYIYIYKPEHPFAHSKKYIPEHRLVMEKHLDRHLKSYEHIHHKNGIKNDNRLSNLQIVYATPHYGNVQCPFCNKKFLIR